jgi:hypothetical protein
MEKEELALNTAFQLKKHSQSRNPKKRKKRLNQAKPPILLV